MATDNSSWFYAIADVFLNGVRLAKSDTLEFLAGFDVVKDPTTGRLQITNTGGGGGGGSGDIKADGTVPFAAHQSMGGFKLTSLGAPTVGGDAVTKTYVDARAPGPPTAVGQQPFWHGGAWKLLGLLTGTDLTNADQTLAIAGGAQYILTAALTGARVKTLSLTGASKGLMVTIYRLNTSANTMAINDAGGSTLFTFPASASSSIVATFRFNDSGTAWELAGWAPLAAVGP